MNIIVQDPTELAHMLDQKINKLIIHNFHEPTELPKHINHLEILSLSIDIMPYLIQLHPNTLIVHVIGYVHMPINHYNGHLELKGSYIDIDGYYHHQSHIKL
jgi:hypothetical protein